MGDIFGSSMEKNACPWLSLSGEAGSLEYATQTLAFMQDAFGGEWEIVNDEGWHSAQPKRSLTGTPHVSQGGS